MRKNKNINIYKIILDIIMTAIMIVLMKTAITGMLLHEALGIGLFLLFIFHKLINYKALSGLLKNFGKITVRSKSMLILDVLLLIDFTATTVTGIMISQALFASAFTLTDSYLVSSIHHSSAYIGLILISVHIGMHWPYIINMIKNKLHIKKSSRIRAILSRIAAVIIMLLGVQSSFNQNVLANIAQPLDVNNISIGSYDSGEENDFISQQDNIINDLSQQTDDEIYSNENDVTLEQYLSSLFCTLCSKHCPLSSPQCIKGETLAQQATEEYYSIYGDDLNSSDEETADESTGVSDADDDSHNGKGKNRTDKETAQPDELTAESSVFAADETTSFNSTDASADGDAVASAIAPFENTIKNAAEYISIMGLYVGGAHYLVKVPKKKK